MASQTLVGLPFFLAVLGLGTVAGTLGSLLGLGGGIIIIPGLTLLLGVDIRYAIGASLVAVIATSSGAAATYVRDRLTNLRLAMLLEVATAAGALCGALLAGKFSTQVLFLLFAGIMGYSAFMMARSRNEEIPTGVKEHPLAAKLRLASSYPDAALKREVPYVVARLPLGVFLMYAAGLLSGLLGIGSGTLKVPAMDRALRLPMKVSSATSNFMMGVTAAASAWVYLARGDIAPLIAGPAALGVLAGSAIGTRLLSRARASRIRTLFAAVLCVIAIQMVLRGTGVTTH